MRVLHVCHERVIDGHNGGITRAAPRPPAHDERPAMLQETKIWMAQGEKPCYLLLNQANRHGIVTGASGTGKTVTLKVMAEGFSQAGVPAFLVDVKGDVTGIAEAGADSPNMQERIARFGIENWSYAGCPTRLWCVGEGRGLPIRITVSDMGPELLARLLGLSDVQEGVLNIVFRVADDRGMLLIDLKDLRAMLNYVSEHAKEFEMDYGRIAPQSVSAIIRSLIAVEDQGADLLFGEPSLDLADWFATDAEGRGYINLLDATKLIQTPQTYAMFLLWMLSELFEKLPEVGDPDKPELVFFFDEAHLLFDGMPKELTDKVIQVVKLIRSKGVGVYFISQSPSDIPDEVLAQLSNRIQHGLRAYTPAEQKAVRAAAAAFRENPAFDSEEAILALGTGEALVSFLDEDGRPCMVENAKILPPQCSMKPASPPDHRGAAAGSRRAVQEVRRGRGPRECLRDDRRPKGRRGRRRPHGRGTRQARGRARGLRERESSCRGEGPEGRRERSGAHRARSCQSRREGAARGRPRCRAGPESPREAGRAVHQDAF